MACLRPQWIVHLVAVVFAVFATLVRASYYLDDTDSSITYVPMGEVWGPSLNLSFLDGTRLYNGTSMTGICFTKNGCTMTIPFNGSGITLYVLMIYALSFNVAIDEGTPMYYHHDGVFGCCNSTIQPLYNFTVYSTTSLSLGNHKLLLTLLGSSSGYGVGTDSGIDAGFISFDYAFVNSSSDKPTDPSSKSTSRPQIGPAIGGAVGGIIAISTVIFVVFLMRRRRRRGDPTVIDRPDPNFLVDREPIVAATYHPSAAGTSSNFLTASSSNPVVEQPPHSSAFPNLYMSHSSSTLPSTSLPPPILPSGGHISTVNDMILTAPDPTLASDSTLAAEEARFLRRLYALNAPADETTELLQAFRARREASSGMAASSRHAEPEILPNIAPPAYYV